MGGGASSTKDRGAFPDEAAALAEFDRTSSTSTLGPDRRERPRRRPSYTLLEIEALRILRVFLHGEFLICLLSDRNTLFVPLRISPVVASAPLQIRYQWQIAERGKALVWSRGTVEERLRLPAMLAYPGAEITSMD
jgi:hypothetical protein